MKERLTVSNAGATLNRPKIYTFLFNQEYDCMIIRLMGTYTPRLSDWAIVAPDVVLEKEEELRVQVRLVSHARSCWTGGSASP
jgi:hypothetical protein